MHGIVVDGSSRGLVGAGTAAGCGDVGYGGVLGVVLVLGLDVDVRTYAAGSPLAGSCTTTFRPTIGVHVPLIMCASEPARVSCCTCAFELAVTFRTAATWPPLMTGWDHW